MANIKIPALPEETNPLSTYEVELAEPTSKRCSIANLVKPVLASDAETIAGTSTSKAITPANLAAKIGVYDIHEVTEFADDHTQAGLNLLDDADAAAQRTTLGLGTMATQAANNVNISGGAVAGITDLAITDGGTGASTAATARTALGVAIGVDVMAYEAWSIHEVEELCSVD